jgi:hypothetical protein
MIKISFLIKSVTIKLILFHDEDYKLLKYMINLLFHFPDGQKSFSKRLNFKNEGCTFRIRLENQL